MPGKRLKLWASKPDDDKRDYNFVKKILHQDFVIMKECAGVSEGQLGKPALAQDSQQTVHL